MLKWNRNQSRSGMSDRCFVTERQFLRFAWSSEDHATSKNQSPTYARFEAFEEQLAHCYFMLHERFITNAALAKFWVDAAMDELQHGSILRFCRERGMMTDLGIDGEAADHIEQLLETVKGIVSDPGVSAEEAFYASLLMEFSEMEDLYEKMITGLAQDHRAMYDTVRARLDNHHATFAEAAARFCNDRGLAAAFENLVSKK